MIPFGLPLYRHNQLLSIRTISLTTHSFLSNQILKFLTLDIILGTIGQLEGTDSKGNFVCIFPDVCGFLGDYPASSQVIHAIRQSAGAPCMHCTFCHQNIYGLPDYSYTTDVHSGHQSFTTTLDRSLILLHYEINANEVQDLGKNDKGLQTVCYSHYWSLLKLQWI